MSILKWFSSQQATKKRANFERSGGAQAEATRSRILATTGPDRPAPLPHAANFKTDRLPHREHLYEVVRDAMLRAGVLAARYKFKVLSLDGRGSPFLIMIDLADPLAGVGARLAEIEATMAQTAKLRHDILITGVYWRMSEPVTAGLPPAHAAPTPNKAAPEPALSYPLAGAGTPPKVRPRHRTPPVDFEDPQMMDSDERAPPLSAR